MIPAFRKSGLLPVGIHDATWDEVVNRLGFNEHRFKQLLIVRHVLNILITYGCTEACIAGSFVTNKELPDDVDVCYDNTYMNRRKMNIDYPEFNDIRYGIEVQQKKYNSEYYAYNDDDSYFLNFFQSDGLDNPMGIVKLTFNGKPL